MATPLLDFSTLVDQAHVRIDGTLYPLRHRDALSLLQAKRLERQAPRVGALLQQDDLTEAEAAEASTLLAAICRAVLDAPEDVHQRLTDMTRLEVMHAFMQLRMTTRAQVGGAPAATSPTRSTGAKRSRASSGSTAAIRKAG